jgi:hypothetical protein
MHLQGMVITGTHLSDLMFVTNTSVVNRKSQAQSNEYMRF